MLTAETIGRLHASLEPEALARTVQEITAEMFPGSESRVYGVVSIDPFQIAHLGAEGARPIESVEPRAEGSSIDTTSPEWVRGRRLAGLTLEAGGEKVGVLEVALDGAADGDVTAALAAFAKALAPALKNTAIFERTKRLTFTDDLTALYNSRFMSLYLDRELKRCRRTRSSLSLLFMDLDGFKEVNDTHGHLAGSRTLVEVGAALERTVRDADVLIRYGGDEFVILFPETPLSGGLVIAERIRQVIGSTRFLESMNIEARVSASIGIAAYPESADDVRSLIASADRAMYQAKSLGKNRVVVATPVTPPNP